MNSEDMNNAKGTSTRTLTFWEVMGSTLAAALGVQSKDNKVRDFTYGNPLHYILSGIIFVAAFVGIMMAVVALVLA